MSDTDFDLYDLETANLVAIPPSEAAALAMVRRAIQEEGPAPVESWALGRSDHHGGSISGQELIERALKVKVNEWPPDSSFVH